MKEYKTVLVIEDSRPTRRLFREVLEGAGFMPLLAGSGKEGLQLFVKKQPDLIVLDVGLPDMNGWEVCHRIRQQSRIPIIMVSAVYTSVDDRVKGLNLGANDYIIKPFHSSEFIARVRAHLRATAELARHEEFNDGYLRINLLSQTVIRDGQTIELTYKELLLLSALLQAAPSVVSNEILFQKVWGYDEPDLNYVRIYLSMLRKKIEPDPKNPTYLITERGVGYRFDSCAKDA